MAASFAGCAQAVRLAWEKSAKLCEQNLHGSEMREVHLSALGVAEQLLHEALEHVEATLWACVQRPAQPAAMPATPSGTSDWRPPSKALNLQFPSEVQASEPARGKFAKVRGKFAMPKVVKADADRKPRASEPADQLPLHTLTPEEEELKAALLDFLDNWYEDEPPELQQACAPPSRIKDLFLQVVPNQMNWSKWIGDRLCNDIKIQRYRDPQGRRRTYFHRCGQIYNVRGGVPQTAAVPKRAVVAKRHPLHRFASVHQLPGPGAKERVASTIENRKRARAASTKTEKVKRPRMDTTTWTTTSSSSIKQNRAEEAPLDDPSTLAKLNFFKGLPQDEFTPEEEALRDALLLFLADWTGSLPATVGDAGGRAGKAAGVGLAKRALLRQGVTLQSWCENRMAAELDLMETSLGTFIERAGQLDRELVRNHVQSAG